MKKDLKHDLVVKHLTPDSKPYYCMSDDKDEKGFGVLVYPSGSKSFIYKYKIDGVQRLLILGKYPYPKTSLADARDEYHKQSRFVKDLRKGSKDGSDPVLEKKLAGEKRNAEELKRRQQLTFHELAEEYIKGNVTGNVVARSEYDIKRVLLGERKKKDSGIDDFKDWRKRKANSITTEDAATLLKAVAKRSAASARNIIKAARPMFEYGLARSIVSVNPFGMSKVKTFLSKSTKGELQATVKDRTLTEDEIKVLWKALGGPCNGSAEARNALRLMLLLGQRPTEVLGLVSEEISGTWWTLPRERTKTRLDKNRRNHTVYLVPEALALIGNKKGHVFGYTPPPPKGKAAIEHVTKNVSGERGHIAINAIGRMIRRNNYFGLEPWGAHDLRRTVRTFMEDIDGISTNAAEAVLNHAQEGTKKNYNHHDYKRQIENALTLWRDKLVEIIGEPLIKEPPANVISIDTARKKAANS